MDAFHGQYITPRSVAVLVNGKEILSYEGQLHGHFCGPQNSIRGCTTTCKDRELWGFDVLYTDQSTTRDNFYGPQNAP